MRLSDNFPAPLINLLLCTITDDDMLLLVVTSLELSDDSDTGIGDKGYIAGAILVSLTVCL